MKDGRGQYAAKKSQELTPKIKRFIEDNPEIIKREILKEFDISYNTLRRHLKIINGDY